MRGQHRLSNNKVKTATKSGMHPDGAGLYLCVSPSGSKSWIFRYTKDKRQHEMGLGRYPTFSLDEARQRANKQRQLLADGIDPLAAKREASVKAAIEAARTITFKDVAVEYLAEMSQTWKTAKDAAVLWPGRFKTYLYPVLGPMPIAAVDTEVVLRTIRPVWLTKRATAERLRSKIEAILNFATVRNYREGDNPATQKLLSQALPQGKRQARHHEALPYAEVPAFMKKLRAHRGRTERSQLVALAVELVILTAARSAEVRGITMAEVDVDRRLWTIPASRMKGGREHVIPIGDRFIEVWAEVWFGGPRANSEAKGKVFDVSDTAMRALARKIAGRHTTCHGFRSSFRDWAAETGVRRELAEAALAHAVGNQVEAAYNRTKLVQQRREVMESWAAFVYGAK